MSNKSGYGVQKASAAFSESVTAGYAVTAYDFDKYGFTSLLSQNDGDNGKALEKSLFLVTQVLTICVDGEILSCVKGVCGDFIVYQMTGESSSTFAGIKAGDVIRVHTNREGRVDSVSTPISTDENRFVKKLWNITDNTGTYNNGNVATGFISEIDHSEKKIMIDAGEDAVFRLTDSIVVSIYSRSAKTCERGSIADLTVGDMVVCKNSYLQLQEIIVARD